MNRIIFSILFFFSLCASAQVQSLHAPAQGGPLRAPAQVAEKVFVHTDKEFYLAGEILWYKIYVVDAATHRPLSLSKIAYIEILSKDQPSVAQAKIALETGLGSGSFQLPFSVRSGNYILRAYTNWMKNTGADFFYEKTITILNTLRDPALLDSLLTTPVSLALPAAPGGPTASPASAPPISFPTGSAPAAATQPAPYDIQFFPEGGNLVAGLPGRVAFRIVDRAGNPLACKGALINSSGDTITRFQSLRFGMGQFTLQPEENLTYRAVLELEDHRQLISQLPAPEKKGYTLQVTDGGNGQLKVIVQTNIQNNDPLVGLAISSRHVPLSTDKKNITNGQAEFTVEKNSLQDGISCFTLLAGNRQMPVCERLWFKAPAPLKIQVQTAQENYMTREKVTVGLSSHNATGLPVKISGSMAVILLDSLQSIQQDDLLSYLFLSSELKGSILSPGYYFSGNTPEVQETADLLMLTQGWRRFRRADTTSAAPPEYAGMLVTGKITGKRTGLPAAGISAWLCAPGTYFHLAYATSDKNGMIQWDLGLLYGDHELVVQTVHPENANSYRIDILSPFSEAPPLQALPDLRLPHSPNIGQQQSVRSQLLWRSIGAQTQNAWQLDKRLHFYQPPVTDSTAFYGQPNKRFLLDDYVRFSTMEEVMREYAKETRVRNKSGDFSVSVQSDQANQIFFETSPLVLLDGMPVPDFNAIIRFDPLKIRKMEVVAKRYFLGDTLYTGILSYSTYQGDLAGFPLDSSAYIREYEALQAHREFYSPLYETVDQQKSRIADLRNLLYWDPAILTDVKGNQSLSFYTSDLPGRYAVITQGITADGRVGKGITVFSVQNTGKK